MPCVPIFRQNKQLQPFQPKFAQNWFYGQNFKSLCGDSRSAPPRDHVCQFSVKTDNFEISHQNLEKLPNYAQYMGSNNVESVAETWIEAEMSWVEVGAWFSNTHFLILKKKNNISFSRYLDFCAFVKSTNFKIYDVITAIVNSGLSTYAYFFWILSTLALDSKLETSSSLFYDFIKITI